MTLKPTKTQYQAITHPPSPLMIIAGAGTGKTFTIEKRIIYTINNFKVDPQNILTITYTEKAAKELKQRIMKKTNKISLKITWFLQLDSQII